MSNKFQNPNLVIKNGVFLVFRMLLVLFLGFFATRLSLQVLGDEKFGIYNIVGGIIAIFAIISLPIRDSLQRFFNVELAKEQYGPDVVFSTSVKIVRLMIIIITILYETVGLYLINFVIQYPKEEHFAVNIIFQLCSLANIFGFAELPYVSLLFSRENMGVPAFCEIGRSTLKILLLLLIPYIPVDSLIPYSGIFLLLNVLVYSFYWVYCRKKYPECFQTKKTNKALEKNMLSFSGWSFIESVAGITMTYVSNVFINVFGGILYNTAYGISKQVQNAVIGFTTNVVKASEPQITTGTTTKNTSYRDQLLMTTVKISYLFIAYVAIVIHFDGELLIGLWLGKVPLYVLEFCELMLLSIVFTSILSPFRTLIMATGRIKGYFIAYGIANALFLVLMYILLKMGYPVIVVLYLIVASSVVSLIQSIYYANKEAGIKVGMVVKNILICTIAILSSAAVYFAVKKILLSEVGGFLLAVLLSFTALSIISYFIVLTSAERNKIKELVNRIKFKVSK